MTLRTCQSVPLFGNMQAASLPINNTVWQALILTNCGRRSHGCVTNRAGCSRFGYWTLMEEWLC